MNEKSNLKKNEYIWKMPAKKSGGASAAAGGDDKSKEKKGGTSVKVRVFRVFDFSNACIYYTKNYK